MARSTTTFICQQCGGSFSKWLGKCPLCDSWGSLVETLSEKSQISGKSKKRPDFTYVEPVTLATINQQAIARTTTGIGEFDTVLGGGIVPGMAVLIAGEPGIGKSTLLLELAANLSKGKGERVKGKDGNGDLHPSPLTLPPVLYVAGEESPNQIKIRANRLGIGTANITLLAQTDVDGVIATIEECKPKSVIIDSVQMLTTQDLSSSAGSVGQVRECTDRLTTLAKKLDIPMFFVGHITKEGSIAGPKVLEHIVDTVLVLEGDTTHSFRILRAVKNRFGSTDEVGVFSMEDEGIKEVTNPSAAFLNARMEGTPGSVVVPTIEGARPILVEVQALVSHSTLALPRRVGIGVDYNRLQFLMALLANRVNTKLAQLDVFVNVTGGLKINEPALDLGICLAVASAYRGIAIDPKLACFGEVGLLGEVRSVRFSKQRISEAKRLGYSKVVSPEDIRSLTAAMATVFGRESSPKHAS